MVAPCDYHGAPYLESVKRTHDHATLELISWDMHITAHNRLLGLAVSLYDGSTMPVTSSDGLSAEYDDTGVLCFVVPICEHIGAVNHTDTPRVRLDRTRDTIHRIVECDTRYHYVDPYSGDTETASYELRFKRSDSALFYRFDSLFTYRSVKCPN